MRTTWPNPLLAGHESLPVGRHDAAVLQRDAVECLQHVAVGIVEDDEAVDGALDLLLLVPSRKSRRPR